MQGQIEVNSRILERFEFRDIRQEEADQAVLIEKICFPPNEACSEKHMKERIGVTPELFLVAVDKTTGKLAGFLNGIATDEEKFRDEFFTDASLNNPKGKKVMILGLDVLPEYRGQGLAREIVRCYLQREEEKGRKEIVLTCLDEKVEMYKRFADNELYNKNYDKAMEYLKKAENLGMNIGDSHVFWEIKEIKDNERKYNSEPNKDLENKRDEYLNKFSEINNEVSEFNYSGTDTQIKDTYSLVLKKWDNALNEIYNDLKNILSSTDMELLRIAQKDWVIRRDKRAEEDSKMYGSNSTEEIEYTKSLADSTKERYYELIENYLN